MFYSRKKYYQQQKLSLIITFMGIIPIYFTYGVYLNVDKNNYFKNIFLFIGSFGYSLYLITFNYLTQKKSVPIFLLKFSWVDILLSIQ